MKIPSTLTIDGQKWKVSFKPLEKEGDFGRCHAQKRLIEIDDQLLPQDRADTFLHELLHACAGAGFDSTTEEALIRRITPRLLKALQGIGWAR